MIYIPDASFVGEIWMTIKDDIKPKERNRVIDLVKAAGVDVDDWSNYDGPPAANPKYCYDWAFVQPDRVVVVNLWHEHIEEDAGGLTHTLNLRRQIGSPATSSRETLLKRRATKLDAALRIAFEDGLPVRAIVLDGSRRSEETSTVGKRLLDPVPWAVTEFDFGTGAFTLRRGATPVAIGAVDPEIAAFEGEMRERFVRHRKREARLRRLKIDEALKAGRGRLICEVPGCGFDFLERYGEPGRGFAHVHHKETLGSAPPSGRQVTLDDLAVVCANCHAMIHVGGQCRDMSELIPSSV